MLGGYRPLSIEALTPEILRNGETPARRFDPKSAAPFVNKSVSEATRRAYTRAPETGLTYRQVQMMSKHKDPKTVMRYDHGRENLEQNAVNFLGYDEE